MRVCLAEGPDGTPEANCVKAYLGAPAADETCGIGFVAEVVEGRLFLRYLGFGDRTRGLAVSRSTGWRAAGCTADRALTERD